METLDHSLSLYPAPVILGVVITLVVLPIVVVAFRFFVRYYSSTGFAGDDWTILFALFLSTAAGIIEILAATIGGMGRHQQLGPQGEFIHTPELRNYDKCRYAILIITTLNAGVVKISIVLFYRRLFPVKSFEIASRFLIGFLILWIISFVSAMAAQCSPPHYAWDLFEFEYSLKCMDTLAMYQGMAYSDLILDVIVLAFPIPMVMSLRLSRSKKIKVIDTLLLSSLVLASAIARVVLFAQSVKFAYGEPERYFHDTTWYCSGPVFWSFAENAIAIIGACLPPLAAYKNWKQSFTEKRNASLSNPQARSNSNHYATLDDGFQLKNNMKDAPFDLRVKSGPVTHIQAVGLPFADRSRLQKGIRVNTSLSAEWRPSKRTSFEDSDFGCVVR